MNTFCVFDVKLKLSTKSFQSWEGNYVMNLKLTSESMGTVMKLVTSTLHRNFYLEWLKVFFNTRGRVSERQKVPP